MSKKRNTEAQSEGNGATVVEAAPARPRKPREKTRYVLETSNNGTAGGWVPLEVSELQGATEHKVAPPDFTDSADALKWVEANVIPPARVRCVVVKFDVSLEEEKITKTVIKPVA